MVVERKVAVHDSASSRDRAEKADKGKPGKRLAEERAKPVAKGNAKAAPAEKAGKPEKAVKNAGKPPAPPAKAKAEPPKRR